FSNSWIVLPPFWRSGIECGLNPQVPVRSGSAERQTAAAVTAHLKRRLPKDVHPEQDIQLKRFAQLKAFDIIKYERERWLCVWQCDPNAENIPFRLSFAVDRSHRALAARR
ncbi:MAG TPA: hypothetical protein VM326_05555, partial [Sphingomicrobium sp.]|nr:hypothetical protein [Sphingomicrobium sp.]